MAWLASEKVAYVVDAAGGDEWCGDDGVVRKERRSQMQIRWKQPQQHAASMFQIQWILHNCAPSVNRLFHYLAPDAAGHIISSKRSS